MCTSTGDRVDAGCQRTPFDKEMGCWDPEAEPVCTVGRAPMAVTTRKFLYPSCTGEDSGNSKMFVIISLSLGHSYPGQKMATECGHGWSWCIHCKKTKESKINSAWDQ